MKRVCSVEHCDRDVYQKGMCSKHYQQVKAHGKVYKSNRELNDHFIFNDIVLLQIDSKEKGIVFVTIDLEDLKKVQELGRWYFDGRGYITTKTKNGYVKLHRFLMNAEKHHSGDHINRNPLDNRKCNLRLTSNQENSFNRGNYKCSKHSKYKGVGKVSGKNDGKIWRARITIDAKQIHLGTFATEREAALAFNKAAKELQGEHAYLNDVE